jgi:endonuclease G
MSRKHLLIALSILLVAITGCQKEDSVALNPRSTSLNAGAGSVFVGVVAQGAWTLSLEYPSTSSAAAWASVNPASGTGSQNDVLVSYSANDSENVREVTLVLTPARGAAARVTLVQAAKAEEAVSGNYGYDVAPMDWLELPAMKAGDGRELLVHDMAGGKYINRGKSGTRNWSCYWDYDEHLSLWVAYPLNNSLKGSGSRKDGWGAIDPCLPQSLQPFLGNGSYGGGWTRGHQIPAADRASSNAAAHRSTYYSTNQTPQDYDFNIGIWAKLEAKVRDYASLSDTLYVVTGALFDKSTNWSGNSSGFRVKVPTHYFKALLFKGTNDATVTDGYMAAGFFFPHDSSIANDKFINYIYSISDLEEKTGIDFFPNLAKKLGTEKAARIETEEPNNFWKK